jgi:hypothetical protein
MSARDEIRDPWGWLVAAVCGGLAWAVLGPAMGMAAALMGLLVGAVVLGTKVAVGVLRAGGQEPEALEQRRDRLPQAPRDSMQAALVARSHAAVERMEDLADRPSDPWIAGEVRSVLTDSRPVVEAIEEMSGRITLLDSSILAARPNALAQEIATLQEQMRRTSDPDVRREQERALTALDGQADSVDRLLRRRDSALAQMQASTVGLEGLAARSGELVALGPAGHDTEEATRIVEELTNSLDSVRSGVDEARTLLRDL